MNSNQPEQKLNIPKTITVKISQTINGETKTAEKTILHSIVSELFPDDIKEILYDLFRDVDDTIDREAWR